MIQGVKETTEAGIYRVTLSNDKIIHGVKEGTRYWPELQDWLNTNSADPAETDDEIKARKKSETEKLAGQKADALLPDISLRRKMKSISKAVKLVRKEAKGNASQTDKDELDALETLDNQIDTIYDAADAIKDEIASDSGYDHINSPLWP